MSEIDEGVMCPRYNGRQDVFVPLSGAAGGAEGVIHKQDQFWEVW